MYPTIFRYFGSNVRNVIADHSQGRPSHSQYTTIVNVMIPANMPIKNSSVVGYSFTEKKFGRMRIRKLHYGYQVVQVHTTKSTVAANGHHQESCIPFNTVRPRWYGGDFADDISTASSWKTIVIHWLLHVVSLKFDHKGAFNNNPPLALWNNGRR